MAGKCHPFTRHGLIPGIARCGSFSEVHPLRVWRVEGVTELEGVWGRDSRRPF
jgi:hypothetical protein